MYLCSSFGLSFSVFRKFAERISFQNRLLCRCVVTVNVLWFFITEPCVGLQFVVVVFPDHTCTRLLFDLHWELNRSKTWNAF